MANVTVTKLAEIVGAPMERILEQMQEAGLTHNSPEEFVSDHDNKFF